GLLDRCLGGGVWAWVMATPRPTPWSGKVRRFTCFSFWPRRVRHLMCPGGLPGSGGRPQRAHRCPRQRRVFVRPVAGAGHGRLPAGRQPAPSAPVLLGRSRLPGVADPSLGRTPPRRGPCTGAECVKANRTRSSEL